MDEAADGKFFDVVCVGNALVDVHAVVADSFLSARGLEKGGDEADQLGRGD